MDHHSIMTMKRYISRSGLLLSAALLTACSFEKNPIQDINGTVPSARIKFFNFGVGAPGVNFYANDTKMTALISTTGAEATAGVAYGGAGSGGFYTGIAAGTYTLAGKISATVDKDLAISSLSATIGDGKYYSYYQSGTYNTTTKKIDSFIVEDPLPALNFDVAYVRFVNAIANSSPMVLIVTNTAATPNVVTTIGTVVPYKAAGEFVAIPSGPYNIGVRVAGATTDAISRTALSFGRGGVYTIAARGTMAATGTAAPALDNTANR
jgi:hypothetical protein